MFFATLSSFPQQPGEVAWGDDEAEAIDRKSSKYSKERVVGEAETSLRDIAPWGPLHPQPWDPPREAPLGSTQVLQSG